MSLPPSPDPELAVCHPSKGYSRSLWMVQDTVTGNAQAKRLCGGCPERVRCLAYAKATKATWGVWGGVPFFKGSFT